MRKLTEPEKQQLQAKIKDEQKRRYQAVRKIARKNNNEEPNRLLSLLFFWDFTVSRSD